MGVGGAIWCVGVKVSCACISGGSTCATAPDAKLIIDHRIKLYEEVHDVRHLGNCSEITSSFALCKRIGTRRGSFYFERFAYVSSPEGGTKNAVGVSRR